MHRFIMLKLVKKYGMITIIFIVLIENYSTLPAEMGLKPGKKNSKLQNQGASAEKEDSYVRSVCFSPDGNYLVAGVEDKTVKVIFTLDILLANQLIQVWNIKSGVLKHTCRGHELDIYSLDFSQDNQFFVSGSGDGKAKIWNMETGLVCLFSFIILILNSVNTLLEMKM